MDLDKAREILQAAIAHDAGAIGTSAACAGLQARVVVEGAVVLDEALGWAQLVGARRPMEPRTPMDLASVTKALVTATLLMQAVDEGLVGFGDPIARFRPAWGELAGDPAREARLLDLLNHASGLPAWRTFYEEYDLGVDDPDRISAVRAEVMAQIVSTPRLAPPGQRHCYSDLGYLLLGDLLEQIFGDRLSTLFAERIARPLAMGQARYVDRQAGDAPIAAAAATEVCPTRGVVVGQVHDENCYLVGGVAGHAGVFATARELERFAAHLLAIDRGAPTNVDPVVTPPTLRWCWSEAARPAGGGSHLGGWDTPSGERSSAGRGFAAGKTVGHLGFTGTSLWIERERNVVAILLTNRVHPSRENDRIKDLRVAFHEAVVAPR